MKEKLPEVIADRLPKPTENAADAAKLVTGVASAFAAIWFPPAAIAGAVLPIVIDRFVERPKKLLLEKLRKGNIQNPSAEQFASFVPMAYKFFEAAKEGEYEHNLEILATYLAGEMGQETPDAASFSRMARRVEGLSQNDLKVMTLIDASLAEIITLSNVETATGPRPFVAATSLAKSPANKWGLTRTAIQDSLVDLVGRGFLIPDGGTRTSKGEEFYFASGSFGDLMARAREHVSKSAGHGAGN